jgi:hypothetical protein
MQTLLLVKITTLLEQKKKKTFSLRLKQIYSIISPNKKNKEFIRSVQKLECDPKGNIDPGFPYRFFLLFFFFSSTVTLIQLLALADMNQKGKDVHKQRTMFVFFLSIVSKPFLGI